MQIAEKSIRRSRFRVSVLGLLVTDTVTSLSRTMSGLVQESAERQFVFHLPKGSHTTRRGTCKA